MPSLFFEKIKSTLKNQHSINYDVLTYGDLIVVCTDEGLKLCNNIKLREQLEK